MIKYNNNTINKLATDATVNKMYYGGNVVYLAVNGEEPPTPVLPSGYTQVEYVETTGNSYVNLQIDPYSALTNSYTLETRLSSYTQSSFAYLISSENARTNPYYGVGLRWNNGTFQAFGGSYESAHDTTVQQIDNGDGTSSFTLNCDSVTHTNNNIPFTLFCGYYSNNPWRFGKAMFYSLSLTMNGNIERNLIPCKRDNDDVAGFYDTVYGVFYTSLSGTPLTAGPIV